MVQLAYRELELAASGSDAQQRVVGNHEGLPRPWNPCSTDDPDYLDQLWEWLGEVVEWINHQYTWDPDTLIPACWTEHPHLARELAVLAHQCRSAIDALTSDAISDWQRLYLPEFLTRMEGRVRAHCADGHQSWPAKSQALNTLDRLDDKFTSTASGLLSAGQPPGCGRC